MIVAEYPQWFVRAGPWLDRADRFILLQDNFFQGKQCAFYGLALCGIEIVQCFH
jgi:hypothetical protein